jgi:hypothetical protein
MTVDTSLDKDLQQDDLIRRAHEQVVILAGLLKQENVYEPIYNHSVRIDFLATNKEFPSNKA